MKKRWMIAVLCVCMMAAMSACGGKKAAEPAAEPVKEQAADEKEEAEIAEAAANFKNPETLDSIEELNQAAGFMVLTLPEYWNYNVNSYIFEPSTGSDGLACVDYGLEDQGKSILISSGKGNENFSLFMGDMDQTEEESGQTIRYGNTEDNFGACWTDGVLSYSVDTIGLSKDENEQLIEELAGITASMPGGQLADEQTSALPNPMVEYETYPELEKHIDFEYLIIPESNGYTCDDIYLIGGEVVQLDYESKDEDDCEATVRTARGTEDITGYCDMQYQDEKIGNITVHKCIYLSETEDDNAKLAWWTDGTYTYSMKFSLKEHDDFDSQVESAVDYTTRINLK
ncbi:MAG: hypothetical protein Q4G60_15360 [bacterium]|nr:hypothetical protein [bacterium]